MLRTPIPTDVAHRVFEPATMTTMGQWTRLRRRHETLLVGGDDCIRPSEIPAHFRPYAYGRKVVPEKERRKRVVGVRPGHSLPTVHSLGKRDSRPGYGALAGLGYALRFLR